MDFSYCLSTLVNKVLFLFLLCRFPLGIGLVDKVSAVVLAMMFVSVPFVMKVGDVGVFKESGKLVKVILGGCDAEEN